MLDINSQLSPFLVNTIFNTPRLLTKSKIILLPSFKAPPIKVS